MEIQISYRNNNKSNIIIVEESNVKKIKDYKSELSKELSILSQYIVLTYNNANLEDDIILSECAIAKNDFIKMTIKVMVQEINKTCNDLNKCHHFFMEYDESIGDLKAKYCSTAKVTDVKLTIRGVSDESKYLRDYLRENESVFKVSGPVTLLIKNESGLICDVEVYWNDSVNELQNKLIKKQIVGDIMAQLMIGNDVIFGVRELYAYRTLDPFLISIGFYISVNSGDKHLMLSEVNFDTKIFHLKELFSQRFGIETDLISLMFEKKDLVDDKTIGFYQLKKENQIQFIQNIRILVSYVDEKILQHIVKKWETIRNIKEELSQKCGINADRIILRLENEELRDESTADSLKFDDTTILLMSFVGDNNIEQKNDIISIKNEAQRTDVKAIELEDDRDSRDKEITVTKSLSTEDSTETALLPNDITSMTNEDPWIYVEAIELEDGRESHEKEITATKSFNTEDITETALLPYDITSMKNEASRADVEATELDNDRDSREKQITVTKSFSTDDSTETVNISVHSDDTVESLRQQLETIFKLTSTDYVVSFKGKILKTDAMLSAYQIGDGDEVVISHSLLMKYSIGGKDNSVKIHRFAFMPEEKVSNFELKIRKEINLEERVINLSYNDCLLEKDSKLEEYGIENESFLMMTITPQDKH